MLWGGTRNWNRTHRRGKRWRRIFQHSIHPHTQWFGEKYFRPGLWRDLVLPRACLKKKVFLPPIRKSGAHSTASIDCVFPPSLFFPPASRRIERAFFHTHPLSHRSFSFKRKKMCTLVRTYVAWEEKLWPITYSWVRWSEEAEERDRGKDMIRPWHPSTRFNFSYLHSFPQTQYNLMCTTVRTRMPKPKRYYSIVCPVSPL